MTPLLALLALRQSADHDLVYLKQGGAAFTMDAFRPAKPNGIGVVYVESGGWFSDHSMISETAAKPFTDRGITVFEVVHGAQPRYKIPEMEAMMSRAIRYVRFNAAKFGVNPSKIGIVGGSAGGHLSLMAAVLGDDGKPDARDPVDRVSSRPNAVVAYFPPTDFVNFGTPGRMPFREPKYLVFRGAFPVKPDATPREMNDVAKDLSPIYGVTKAFPPTLLIHGDKDDLVPVQQSQAMDAALAKAGVEHRLIVVPGTGHGGSTADGHIQEGVDWFLKELGG